MLEVVENILIVDTETTGLSPINCQMIELAAILYNVKHKAIIQQFSTLLPCDYNPVQHINNISPLWTHQVSSIPPFYDCYSEMLHKSDRIVAQNAQFDKGFLNAAGFDVESKPWICTQRDFKWPVYLERRRLKDICQAMGVEYVEAHRALTDCQFLVKCFDKIPHLFQLFNEEYCLQYPNWKELIDSSPTINIAEDDIPL